MVLTDEPCMSEVGAGKSRIKAEKTSDDREKPGNPGEGPLLGKCSQRTTGKDGAAPAASERA